MYAEQYEYTGDCATKEHYYDFEECLEEELASYDKELNTLYKTLFKNGSDARLKKAERSWLKFKEDDCDYMAYEVNSGKYYQEIYNACLINKTKARIAELKRPFFYFGWFKKIETS